ncbi:MAG: glutamyl-tRNA reductase [Flavobacteriaceae bacterium]|nr:MAG: glutamyl-tRNA reductase [Flavobacteriaceae bacterium]
MNSEQIPTKFYNVGLSYKKADVKMRGAFSISKENQLLLLQEAKSKGINGIIVMSTCNRTEITGFSKHPFELISLMVKYSNGNVEDFIKVSSVTKNNEAVRHLFNIGTGLESQILGDYEIVGQLKQAYQQAKDQGTTNAYIERLMNSVLQASKAVKNQTNLSSGTTSVSYAAVQYLMNHFTDVDSKKIVVYGLGDIGKNTTKNLLEYTGNRNIHLVNRTKSKAEEFAKENDGITLGDQETLNEAIHDADVLIVATGASVPTINKASLNQKRPLVIIDLAMPENVDRDVLELDGVTLINVDELSEITKRTLEARKNEIPAVEKILEKYKGEFDEWINHRKFVPAISALKDSLRKIQQEEINFQSKKIKDLNIEHAEAVTNRMIQKITTQFVKHLKHDDTTVNQSIDVMSKVFNMKELCLNEDA